jgi:hypothetical protein
VAREGTEDEKESKVDNKSTVTAKPSRGLDELKSEGGELTRADLPEERRSSLFDEFDGTGTIEEFEDTELESESEAEPEIEESTPEGDGITVDEEGTEWWEDEEGVWWYREDGWEDWAVWED